MKLQEKRLFSSIVISYIVLLITMWGLSITGYSGIRQAAHLEVCHANERLLNQVQRVVDDKIRSVDQDILKMILDPDFQDFSTVGTDMEPAQIYKAVTIIRDLATRTNNNEDIRGLFLFYPASGKILSTGGMYSVQDFYQYFAQNTNVPYAQWLQQLSSANELTYYPFAFDETSENSALSILCPFPLYAASQESRGILCLSIQMDAINLLIDDLVTNSHSILLKDEATGKILYASDHQVIEHFSQTDPEALKNRGYIVNSLSSAQHPWTYYSIYDENEVLFREITQASTFMNFITLIMGLVGILIVVWAVFCNWKPIEAMAEKNAEYQQRIDRLSTEIRSKVIRDFLEGVLTEDEQRNLSKEIHLRSDYAWNSVVLIRCEDEKKQPLLAFVLEDLIRDAGHNVPAILLNYKTVVFIAQGAMEESPHTKISILLDEILHPLSAEQRMSLSICCGSSVDGLNKIQESYAQAKKTLDRLRSGDCGRAVFSDDIFFTGPAIYFPLDFGQRLYELLGQKERGKLEAIVRHLFESNPNLPNYLKYCFQFSVVSSVMQALLQYRSEEHYVSGYQTLYELIAEDVSSEELQKEIVRILTVSCKQNCQDELTYLEQTKRYIDIHYKDPAICAETVAQQMGLTANYLSVEFKRRYQHSLTGYINYTRVKAAKVLLIESSDSINQIAVQVGYTNLMTFLRNFKKYEDMTPTQYRTNYRENLSDETGN